MRQMIRAVALLFGLAGTLCLAWWTPRANGAAPIRQVTTSLWIPFPDGIVNSEPVDFSGFIHMVVQAIPTDATIPGDPCRIHTNLVNVTGVGSTSHTFYRATGAANFEYEEAPPGDYAARGFYRLYPGDPCFVDFLVTVHADGGVGNVLIGLNGGVIGSPPG